MIWRPIHLEAKNFLSYKALSWSIPPGTTLIQGENLDETWNRGNASGKSSLVETIPYALYGWLLRQGERKSGTLDEAINKIEKKGCYTTVTFSDGVRILRITRYRKDRKWGDKVVAAWDEGEVFPVDVEWVSKTLGTSLRAFLLSNVFGQGSIKRFAEATETEQIKILEELIQLGWISKARDLASTDAAVADRLVGEIQKEISENAAQLAAESSAYKTLREEFENQQGQIQSQWEQWTETKEAATKMIAAQQQVLLTLEPTISKLTQAKQRNIQEIIAHKNLLYAKQTSLPVDLIPGKPCPKCGAIVQKPPKAKEVDQIAMAHIQRMLLELENKGREIDRETIAKNLQIQEARQALGRAEGELTQATSELDRLIVLRSRSGLKTAMEEKKKLVDFLEGTLADLRVLEAERIRNLSAFKFWQGAFSNQGLKRWVIQKFVPVFEKMVNEELAFLTDGAMKIRIAMQAGEIQRLLILCNGVEMPFFLYNGGGKERINIGIFIAGYKFGRLFSQSGIDLLLLDEIYDHLDRVGIEKVAARIRGFGKGVILTVGHQESLEAEFSQVVTVVKQDGFSRIQN